MDNSLVLDETQRETINNGLNPCCNGQQSSTAQIEAALNKSVKS